MACEGIRDRSGVTGALGVPLMGWSANALGADVAEMRLKETEDPKKLVFGSAGAPVSPAPGTSATSTTTRAA